MPKGEGILVDSFARTISYLRISVTDHCNLRCMYCTPREQAAKIAHRELLTYEELERVARVAVQMGIRKIRLTGGEPLARRNFLSFVSMLAVIPNLNDIRITTNGYFLFDMAEDLYRSGIRRLNISLDSLNRDSYRRITGVDCFDRVWSGIVRARELGFESVKINVVVMRGINDGELVDFVNLTRDTPLQVRFIEFMPIGDDTVWDASLYMPTPDIKECILALGPMHQEEGGRLDGPAQIYRLPGAQGTIGFISPISNHFCNRCNRLRLTAEGRLRSCLFSDLETDIKAILRSGSGDDAIRKALLATVESKPQGHRLAEGVRNCHGRMSRIGG